MSEFNGLSLEGVEMSDSSSLKRSNFLKLNDVITPAPKLDIAGNVIPVKYGRDNSFYLQYAPSKDEQIALHFILRSPLPICEPVNKGTEFECMPTDDGTPMVYHETIEKKKPLPRFRAISEHKRGKPRHQFKAEDASMYMDLFAKFDIDVESCVAEEVSPFDSLPEHLQYLPYRVKSDPDKDYNKKGYHEPVVYRIELLEN